MTPWLAFWSLAALIIYALWVVNVFELTDKKMCIHYGRLIERAQEIKDSVPEA